VTYTFTASSPGTRAYYSGTQGDLQVEMGLYGAIIVLPKSVPSGLAPPGWLLPNLEAEGHLARNRFPAVEGRLRPCQECYDREYLFQFAEMDQNIHARHWLR
jgi:FtsP/CotA-like multicopper oxidase with cupredoxin domain